MVFKPYYRDAHSSPSTYIVDRFYIVQLNDRIIVDNGRKTSSNGLKISRHTHIDHIVGKNGNQGYSFLDSLSRGFLFLQILLRY